MGAPDTSTIAVLAEKPSVARDIARVLGADKQGAGYLQGNGCGEVVRNQLEDCMRSCIRTVR
jgi:hypothetical protein